MRVENNMNTDKKTKIALITLTYLIHKQRANSKELLDFINNNHFKLNTGVTPRELYAICKTSQPDSVAYNIKSELIDRVRWYYL